MTYSEKLKDPRWQKKRLEVMQRDDWKCRDCGQKEKTLQVHHCFYEKEPWDASSDLLLTVCDQCHKSRQSLEDGARLMIGQISSKLTQGKLEEYLYRLACDVGGAA